MIRRQIQQGTICCLDQLLDLSTVMNRGVAQHQHATFSQDGLWPVLQEGFESHPCPGARLLPQRSHSGGTIIRGERKGTQHTNVPIGSSICKTDTESQLAKSLHTSNLQLRSSCLKLGDEMKPSSMNSMNRLVVLGGAISLSAIGGYVSVSAQNTQGPRRGQGGQFGGPPVEEAIPLPGSKMAVVVRNDYRYITSNGIPDHAPGEFPNAGNPNAIRPQNHSFRATLQPARAEQTTAVRRYWFGIAVNGVPFEPATGEFWNNDRRWNYDALSGKVNLGFDTHNAHVQPGGIYHYHGVPTGVVAKRVQKNQMTMVGLAGDGFPIYALHGYAEANNPKSALKQLRSSYRLKEGTRPNGDEGPGGTYDGTFNADWEYVAASGDLDECNGRTGVTADYPKGTYYYVLTDHYPFMPRSFRGTPDETFKKVDGGPPGRGQGGQRGGPSGPGGRQGSGPSFGPPPPGFGPPPGHRRPPR
jgi:hypothetical protein